MSVYISTFLLVDSENESRKSQGHIIILLYNNNIKVMKVRVLYQIRLVSICNFTETGMQQTNVLSTAKFQ